MYFDGAVNNRGAGIDVILISPEGKTIPMAKRLEFEVTNNQVEYEACIFGLEALQSAGAGEITVYGDSMLVMKQISNEWKVKEDRLRPYWDYSATVLLSFAQSRFVHLPREENQMADALTTLASTWKIGKQAEIKPLILMKSQASCYSKVLFSSFFSSIFFSFLA